MSNEWKPPLLFPHTSHTTYTACQFNVPCTMFHAHSVHTVDTNCTQTQTAYSEPTTHTTNTTHTVPTDHPTHFTYTIHTTNTVQIAPTTRSESTIYYKYTVQRFLKIVLPSTTCTIVYYTVPSSSTEYTITSNNMYRTK